MTQSIKWGFIVSLAAVLAAHPVHTKAQEMDAAMEEMDPAMAEMMEKWQAYSNPNENHRVLDAIVGDWEHTVTWWMEAGSEAEESTGTSTIQWILNGRFLQHEAAGMSMGEPFTGLGLTGFDNVKQKYVNIWIDSMGTGIMASEGVYDEAAKTITDSGTYSCPMTSNQRTYRAVISFIDDDHYTYTMYTNDLKTGEEYKSMEIAYTRK